METMYRVDFIKVTDEDQPVPGTGWSWSGTTNGVGTAVETAVNTMIDTLEDCGRYRILKVVNMRLERLLEELRG